MGKRITDLLDLKHGDYIKVSIGDADILAGRVSISNGVYLVCQNQVQGPVHKSGVTDHEKFGLPYSALLFDKNDEDTFGIFQNGLDEGAFHLYYTNAPGMKKINGEDISLEQAIANNDGKYTESLLNSMLNSLIDGVGKKMQKRLDEIKNLANSPGGVENLADILDNTVKDAYEKTEENRAKRAGKFRYNKNSVDGATEIKKSDSEKDGWGSGIFGEKKSEHSDIDDYLIHLAKGASKYLDNAGEQLLYRGFLEGKGKKSNKPLSTLIIDLFKEDEEAVAIAIACLQYLASFGMIDPDMVEADAGDGSVKGLKALVTLTLMIQEGRDNAQD